MTNWIIITKLTILKLQDGAGFNQILSNLSIILAFALAFFLIAAYRFSKKDSIQTFI